MKKPCASCGRPLGEARLVVNDPTEGEAEKHYHVECFNRDDDIWKPLGKVLSLRTEREKEPCSE